MDDQHNPIKEYQEAASVLVSRDGNLSLAEELSGVLRSYRSRISRSWESDNVFDMVRLEGIRKALTLPRAIRIEGESVGHAQPSFKWIENAETKMVGVVAGEVKGFLQNAGVVARIIGSKTRDEWERAYCKVKARITELPESTCTKEDADVICAVIEKNLPVLSSEVSIWRKGHSGWNRFLTFVRKYWLAVILSIAGGGTVILNINLPGCNTEMKPARDRNDVCEVPLEAVSNLHTGETLNRISLKEFAAKNPDTHIFINCSFNGCTIGNNIIGAVKSTPTLNAAEVLRDVAGTGDLRKLTVTTPLLQDPPTLLPVVRRLRKAIENKNGEKAVVEAITGESIIAEYWKPYTNDTFTVTRSFAENVANVYITLSQEAMGRGDFASAAIRCGIARQMIGTNVPPHVIAIQMVCAVRSSGGELLTFDEYSLEMFSKMRPSKLLYDVFDCLARWGYLLPYVFDFKTKRQSVVNLSERLCFDRPLHYASIVSLHSQSTEGKAIASSEYICQWQGFDKYTMVDLGRWAKAVLDRFANDKDLIESGRSRER